MPFETAPAFNDARGEDFVAIYYPHHSEANQWNDWNDRSVEPIGLPFDGVVEIVPKIGNKGMAVAASARSSVARTGAVSTMPDIVITSDSGEIKLHWPISASDYMLEAATNLAQPFAMLGYSEMTNVEAGVIYVTITNPVPQMYFRLLKP